MDFRDIDKKLKTEFAEKRLKAETIAENNLAKLTASASYSKVNFLLKDLILKSSKKQSKTSLSKQEKNNLKAVKKLYLSVLKSMGLSEKDVFPQYSCKICDDTGFVGGKMCECYKTRRNEEIIKACGLNFENKHDLENYNTKICKDEKQAKQLDKLKTVLQTWLNSYPNNKKRNIAIIGKTGVGKTYLMESLATELFNKGESVCFLSAFSLNSMLTNFHTDFSNNKSSWIAPILDCDVLMIDDLGTEPMTRNVTENYLYLILSERDRMKKPVIISSNLGPGEILDRYHERIYSRLFNKQTCFSFNVEGIDLRVEK